MAQIWLPRILLACSTWFHSKLATARKLTSGIIGYIFILEIAVPLAHTPKEHTHTHKTWYGHFGGDPGSPTWYGTNSNAQWQASVHTNGAAMAYAYARLRAVFNIRHSTGTQRKKNRQMN